MFQLDAFFVANVLQNNFVEGFALVTVYSFTYGKINDTSVLKDADQIQSCYLPYARGDETRFCSISG